MSSYYYLMASLPMLRSDGELPFSYEDFLEMCRSAVSGAKYTLLKELSLSSEKGPLVGEWAKFYTALERELIRLRNRRLGRQEQADGERDDANAAAISAAIGGKNPLEAEQALLALEFQKLDELIGLHSFDDHALLGYALKLKLLERKRVFDQKKGKAELGRILGALQKEIMLDEQE